MSGPQFRIPQLGNRPSHVQKEFKRAYMACIPCRKTKAKCEISEDSPDCVKCRRERRECIFTNERSAKRRKTDAIEDDDLINQNGFSTEHGSEKPTNILPVGSPPGSRMKDRSFDRANFTSGSDGNTVTSKPTQRGTQTTNPNESHHDTDYNSDVVNTVISSSKDALGLLFRAAEQQDTDESEDQGGSSALRAYDSPASAFTGAGAAMPILPSTLSSPAQSVIELWSQHRFVRQGWFSAVEAVTYIDLFFRNLSSLSPISNSFYADHSNHRSLILEEPLLCCTLLMISSRYHILPGPGGASRGEFIHMRLWKHCEYLIQRITFGQEKYSIAKSRTLGSIKALLLMTEWHPRALHFPPEHDGWDASLAPSIDDSYGNPDRGGNAHLVRWREEVFEPAKRSDRMSWMLLGLATTLAHELGIFEDPDPEDCATSMITPIARMRARRLLFLYVNQLSLRLGCTSFLPQTYAVSLTPPRSDTQDTANRERDMMISHWIDITKLRKTTTEMFFPNKATTRQIMASGRYISLLEHFQPLLAKWHQDFMNMKTATVPVAAKQMLMIDYSYVRMYINSIAIQALVERAKTRGTSTTLDYDFVKKDNRQDYKFIQEVVEASTNVLSIAVELAEAGVLRYCPVRVFLRVTSASIFLLKAISLGIRHSDLQKSLEMLEKCIHALRFSTHDDMHLSSRYGMLINRHVRRFKRNFRVQSNLKVPITPPPNKGTEVAHANASSSGTESWNANLSVQQGFDTNIADVNATIGDISWEMDDWLSQPFDPSFAPFGVGINQAASGLEMDSLDFLWNLPT